MDNNSKLTSSDICVVVLSHVSYSDLWPITLESLMPSVELDIYLASDKFDDKFIHNYTQSIGLLSYPPSSSWGQALEHVLRSPDLDQYKYILFTFDDLVLHNAKSTYLVKKALNYLYINKPDYFSISGYHRKFFGDLVSFFLRNDAYGINPKEIYNGTLVFSFWRKRSLALILEDMDLSRMNPWQFEKSIAFKIPTSYQCLSISRRSLIFENIVVKGKILSYKLQRVEKVLGIKYIGQRERLSQINEVRNFIYTKIFNVFRYILPVSITTSISKVKARFE